MDRGRFRPWRVFAFVLLFDLVESSTLEFHEDLLDWLQASDVQAALRRLPTSRLEALPANVRDLLLESQSQQPGGNQERYRLLAGQGSESDHVQHGSTDGGHEGHHAHEAIAYLVVVLVCGIATYHVLSHHHNVPIPYTVALFFEGQLLGIIHNGLDKRHWGTLSNSIEMWVNIDYHVLLYTFLPCLLFGDSLSMNWCLWKHCFTQCFLLAGPGVVMGAGLTALVGRYILPYGWDWSTCLTFGSIMAATDPVAVVGLLKELGAAKALTMQISGEALLNDGFAIVAWTVCFKAMVGESISASDVVWKFLQLAVGGVAAGWLMGSILLSWLLRASDKMQEHDHVIQIALTITCSYITFFFAENDLHFSGVLAVVFGAVCVSRAAWPLFTDHKGLVVVWHTIEFIGNTIVFVLAGTITGGIMGHMRFADYGWLLVTYTCAIFIRGAMIMLLYPILARLGPGCNWKDALIMTWGGLRGAVGLALAIAVANNEAVDKQVGTQIAFHVSGLASLTLLLNATTCAPLLKALGMTNKHIAHLEMVDGLRATLKSITKWSYMALSSTEKFHQHDRKAIRAFVSSLQELNDEQEEQDRTALGEELQKRITHDNKDMQRVARVMSFASVNSLGSIPDSDGRGVVHAPTRGSVDLGLSQIQKLARTINVNPMSNGKLVSIESQASSADADSQNSVRLSSEDSDDDSVQDFDQDDGVDYEESVKNENGHRANSKGSSKEGADVKVAEYISFGESVKKEVSTKSADFNACQTIASRGSQGSTLPLPTQWDNANFSRRASEGLKSSASACSALSARSAVSSMISADEGENSARMAAADVMHLIKDVAQKTSRREVDWCLEDSEMFARACLYLPTERDLFLSVLQATYWKFISDGLVPSQSQATTLLLRSVDHARMHTNVPLADGAALLGNLMCGHQRASPRLGWLQALFYRVLDGDNIGFMIVPCRRGKYHVFDLFALVSFMDAHEMCRKKMKDFKVAKDSDLWNARMKVMQESQNEERLVREFLEDNMIGSNMVERVRTKQMAFQLLLQQEQKVNDWLNLGAIDCTDAEELLHDVKLDHARLLKPWREVVNDPAAPSKPALFASRTSVNLNSDLDISAIIDLQKPALASMDFPTNPKDNGGAQSAVGQGSVRLAAYAAQVKKERRSGSKQGVVGWSSESSATRQNEATSKPASRRGSKERSSMERRVSRGLLWGRQENPGRRESNTSTTTETKGRSSMERRVSRGILWGRQESPGRRDSGSENKLESPRVSQERRISRMTISEQEAPRSSGSKTKLADEAPKTSGSKILFDNVTAITVVPVEDLN